VTAAILCGRGWFRDDRRAPHGAFLVLFLNTGIAPGAQGLRESGEPLLDGLKTIFGSGTSASLTSGQHGHPEREGYGHTRMTDVMRAPDS
jgi:hypothetical protein